jgi:hypothetical protein
MILVVSGEGPSDIGRCENGHGECSGKEFVAGPMAIIIDKLVEPIANYSLLRAGAIEFISESCLAGHAKKLPKRKLAISIGKRRKFETAYHFKNARALAFEAKKRAAKVHCPVGAVLFRDADGTRSTEKGLFEAKWNSMVAGFEAEDFDHGIPMVPKPKSEAWLLCALKAQPYQHCAGLENSLSGNDNNPNPAKQQLANVLIQKGKTVGDLADMVEDETISTSRIDMPSFNRFRRRLEDVTRRMLGRPA